MSPIGSSNVVRVAREPARRPTLQDLANACAATVAERDHPLANDRSVSRPPAHKAEVFADERLAQAIQRGPQLEPAGQADPTVASAATSSLPAPRPVLTIGFALLAKLVYGIRSLHDPRLQSLSSCRSREQAAGPTTASILAPSRGRERPRPLGWRKPRPTRSTSSDLRSTSTIPPQQQGDTFFFVTSTPPPKEDDSADQSRHRPCARPGARCC